MVAAALVSASCRVQSMVDRELYRSRHIAQQMIRRIDLQSVAENLKRVVASTVQPAPFSPWLREAPTGAQP